MNEHAAARKDWIDIAKGLTIILIVIGNIPGIDGRLKALIFSFHIPLFLIINGYLIDDYDPVKTFKQSVKILLAPYGAICLAEAFILMLKASDFKQAGVLFFRGLSDGALGMSEPSTLFPGFGTVGPVWIITCLFLAENIYVVLMHFIKDLPVLLKDTLILAISLGGYLLARFVGFLPWNLDVALYCVLFIAIGDFFKGIAFFEDRQVLKVLVPLLIWVNIFLYQGIYVDLSLRQYPFIFSGAAAAAGGSIFVMQCCIFIGKFSDGLSRVMIWYGKHFILILSLHTLEMRLFPCENAAGAPLSGFFIIQAVFHLLLVSAFAYLLSKIHKDVII